MKTENTENTKQKQSHPSIARPLAELHSHLGTSVDPRVLWELAHDQGIKLPRREYHEFREFVKLSPSRKMALNEYFEKVYHPILDRLTTGTHAVEQATYQTISGGYRSGGIVLMELRNNLIKHTGGRDYDLDHTVMAMLRGMERALLAHADLSAGLIFCMGRDPSFTMEMNAHIVDKAIKYRKRGVVGIDLAGPGNPNFKFKDYEALFNKARKAGLGITVHTGEQKDANDMWDALKYAKPDRIGHGILAAYDQAMMKELREKDIVLEVCPMSNIVTKAVEGVDELRFILRTLIENGVKFCINTDWPEIIEGCQLHKQFDFILEHELLTEDEIEQCRGVAFEASFIQKKAASTRIYSVHPTYMYT